MQEKQKNIPSIPQPSQRELEAWLDFFKTDSIMKHYLAQESALNMLFKAYPKNENIDEILIKVATLNSFYSTNILNIFGMATHIKNIKNIDERLKNGDEKLVGEIAKSGLKNKKGKEIIFYSFATKFCSHHNDKDFAIYDSYVAKVLMYFKNLKDNNKKFKSDSFHKQNDLKDYVKFKNTLRDFKTKYKLNANLKDLDRYLWQFGKKYFPRYKEPQKTT